MVGHTDLNTIVQQLHSLEDHIASATSERENLEFLLKTEKKKQETYESQISAFQNEIRKLHDIISGYQRNQEDLLAVKDENVGLKKEIHSLLRRIDEIRDEADERTRQLQQQLGRVEKDHEMQVASTSAEMRFEFEEKLQAMQAHLEARESKILELNSRIQQSEENATRRVSELKNQYEKELQAAVKKHAPKVPKMDTPFTSASSLNIQRRFEQMQNTYEQRILDLESKVSSISQMSAEFHRKPTMTLDRPSGSGGSGGSSGRGQSVQSWHGRGGAQRMMRYPPVRTEPSHPNRTASDRTVRSCYSTEK